MCVCARVCACAWGRVCACACVFGCACVCVCVIVYFGCRKLIDEKAEREMLEKMTREEVEGVCEFTSVRFCVLACVNEHAHSTG